MAAKKPAKNNDKKYPLGGDSPKKAATKAAKKKAGKAMAASQKGDTAEERAVVRKATAYNRAMRKQDGLGLAVVTRSAKGELKAEYGRVKPKLGPRPAGTPLRPNVPDRPYSVVMYGPEAFKSTRGKSKPSLPRRGGSSKKK